MTGYNYGEPVPDIKCPYCGGPTYAEYVDIGVGMQQVTGHMCEVCQAVEAGPYCDITKDDYDNNTGWFRNEH